MLLALYRRQQERGWTEGIVELVERVIEESGSYRRPARPPAFTFVDLAGYTRITDERGEAGARLAGEMSTMVERLAADHAGTPVKWLSASARPTDWPSDEPTITYPRARRCDPRSRRS